ncbi:hypothetical protein [Halobacillus kuroshimensis]|uniref:hypothetical protein n=1 Tax=Halobacillus kuroshimensis TaxID=302481 RepID=UPI0004062B86|nr:hypothetical protein [Halobacillus kuroshimensis]
MRPAKSVKQMSMKMSKDEISAREEAEAQVLTNNTKPKQNDIVKNNISMRKVFNQLKKFNEHFTEADSIPLNTLTFNIYIKQQNEDKLLELDVEDHEYERFLLRLDKIDKKIDTSMKQLCIPLNARLSLANDMAKVMIEERKLENIETEKKPVNPLDAVLEATKHIK